MNSSARTTRSRRWTAAVVGGAAGAVLLGGGIALADGPGSDTGSSTVPGGSGTGAPVPADDHLVGTITAVSDDSLTLTDDTGTSHDVALTDQTRFGGPGGPGAGGPGAGGPGAGGPEAGGPSAGEPGAGGPGAGGSGAGGSGADGSGAPEAPGDASGPAAPSGGSTPPAPADGSTPPAPADDATPPAPSDGSTPPAPVDGNGAPAPADAPAPPEVGAPDDLAVGDRVEVRVSDGTALEVREVHATVDGTVVAVEGTDLTVVTTPGLRVDVDAGALPAVPAVGDDVHLHGTVGEDGRTVVADESDDAPR